MLEEAIRRMTSLPAATFQLEDCGQFKTGFIADIVLLDAAKVTDPRTFADPHHHAEGIPHVLVNGRPVLCDAKLNDERPGQIVRKSVK